MALVRELEENGCSLRARWCGTSRAKCSAAWHANGQDFTPMNEQRTEVVINHYLDGAPDGSVPV